MKRFLFLLSILCCLTCSVKGEKLQPGYRGFVDWSNSMRSYQLWEFLNKTDYYTGVSTSHGYQFNNWFYAGAGMDFEYCTNENKFILAPFIDGRADLTFGKITPFGDIRVGYSVNDGGGIYFSPSIGYRFNWGNKIGLNFGLGLTLKGYNKDLQDAVYYPEMGWWDFITVGKYRGCYAFFSFRLGIDF